MKTTAPCSQKQKIDQPHNIKNGVQWWNLKFFTTVTPQKVVRYNGRVRIKAVTSCSTHKIDQQEIPDYKVKLKTRQLQVMGKNIQGKLITQAMNGTSVANRCNHQVLRIEQA